jgi:phage terminase large subunit-like protein
MEGLTQAVALPVPAMPPPPDWIATSGYAWAASAWNRASRVPGAWFDEGKADAIVALWPNLIVHTDDRFAGRPFWLNGWEQIVIKLFFGWKVPVDTIDETTGRPKTIQVRQFRKLLIWLARKNGKSEFIAGISLIVFIVEGVYGGQGFAFALNEAQGRMVFDKMAAMIQLSPRLQKKVVCFKKSLWVAQIKSSFQLLSGKAEGKHGRSPTVIAGDEMHEWTDGTLELSNSLRQGTGARLEPVELYASTAGLKTARTGYGLWEQTMAIVDGRIEEPTTLAVVFAADQDDDWADEKVWPKANPTFPVSPTLQFLRTEAALAKESPRAEAHFRRYHLNQWVDQAVRWLDRKRWEACAPDSEAWTLRFEAMKGRKCYVALDASATQDITALLALFPPVDEGEPLKLLCRFFVPEETIPLRARRDRVLYDDWAKTGALTATPGDVVDQDFMKKAIEEWLKNFEVVKIGRDPWNTIKLVTDLQKDGVNPELIVDLRQGHRTLGEPSKEFERLVLAGKLDHGGHPVLGWMAGHVAVRFDENMNFVPDKKHSADKIDGIQAAVMTVALWMAEGGKSEFLTEAQILARAGDVM